MITNTELPFSLTGGSLASWLALQDCLPPAKAATHLSMVLKVLKNSTQEPKQLLPVTIELIPLTLKLANILIANLSVEGRSQEKLGKAGKLSMHLPRQLSLVLCQLVESEKLDGDQLQVAIFHGLQMIGHCLLFYARLYERPSATLWKKSAILFKQAWYGDFHKQKQTTPIDDFSTLTSIENVAQRNILFCLMNPTLFDKNEIDGLFAEACQLAHQLEFTSPREFNQIGFCWDLASDMPPAPLKHVKNQLSKDQLVISCRTIGHSLQIGEIGTSLSRKTQARLALFLTGYDQIFSTIIPGLPSRSMLISGFKNIVQYQQEQSKLSKIQNLSAQVSGGHSQKRDMSLVPLEHQRNVFESVDRPFMHQTQLLGRQVNVLRTPNQNYSIIDGKTFDCITGDLVMLCKEQHPNALMIVRQQRQNDVSGSTHVLLEKISHQCEIYGYSDDKNIRYLLMIGENTAHPEVFMAGDKLSIGDRIELIDGRNLVLTQCLEASDLFNRFRVSFD